MSAAAERSERSPRHLARISVIWVVLSIVGDVVYYFVLGPHIPPGTLTSTAADTQLDFNVLLLVALPVLFGVWTYLAYAVIVWRAGREGLPEPVGGAGARGNRRLQVAWIGTTSLVVVGLFVFGTVALASSSGSGGGQGPNPLFQPSAKNVLPVQVIAQQWKFTYRYPTFGGFETTQLVLPVDTTIAFHVTSLDVIHDFWAYQLGVKADANPLQDNVAYTTTRELGSVTVRCDELCGIWHGSMYDYGKVVSKFAFSAWAKGTESTLAANTRLLPPFAYSYVPDANGADGGYYPDNVDPYSNVEVYGAKQPVS